MVAALLGVDGRIEHIVWRTVTAMRMVVWVIWLNISSHLQLSNMSNTKSKKIRRKKFLMGVKEYWLIEEALMPTYTHLIDLYSHKQQGTFEVKEECEDSSTVSQPDDEIISTKQQVG